MSSSRCLSPTNGANSTTDASADRAHAKTIEEQVDVWGGASAGQLPASVTAGAPTRTPTTRTRRFDFDDGVLKHSELVGVLSTDLGYTSAGNAPGKVMNTTTATPATASASPILPPQSPIARTFHYDGAGAFLKAIESAGERIETPQPHRDRREPQSTTDGIQAQQTFDAHGQLKSAKSSGGNDGANVGASSSIDYWEDTQPKYKRGMTRVVKNGSLQTQVDYPDETHVRSTDPAGVITTTELDTWNRPKHVTITKPGDPLVITEDYEYEASGRVHAVVQRRAAGDVTTTYAYDAMGRQKSVTTNQLATVNTATTTTDYDFGARKIVTTQPGGAVTTGVGPPRTHHSFGHRDWQQPDRTAVRIRPRRQSRVRDGHAHRQRDRVGRAWPCDRHAQRRRHGRHHCIRRLGQCTREQIAVE